MTLPEAAAVPSEPASTKECVARWIERGNLSPIGAALPGANRWCHKPGSTAATNRDTSDDYIPNVGNADRLFNDGVYRYNYNEIVDTFFGTAGATKMIVV